MLLIGVCGTRTSALSIRSTTAAPAFDRATSRSIHVYAAPFRTISACRQPSLRPSPPASSSRSTTARSFRCLSPNTHSLVLVCCQLMCYTSLYLCHRKLINNILSNKLNWFRYGSSRYCRCFSIRRDAKRFHISTHLEANRAVK